MPDGRVLIIDDDEDVRRLVRWLLESAGFTTAEAATGREGLRVIFLSSPDVVILDVAMPELDGFEVLERIREVSNVPVLMLSARGTEAEKVRGLRGGADDYLTKPFGREELLARVELLRNRSPQHETHERLLDDYLEVDVSSHDIRVKGVPVFLTPREFQLLIALMRHPNHVLSRQQLSDWTIENGAGVSPDHVKVHIGALRRKLEHAAGGATPIETVRGVGYRYRRSARTTP